MIGLSMRVWIFLVTVAQGLARSMNNNTEELNTACTSYVDDTKEAQRKIFK